MHEQFAANAEAPKPGKHRQADDLANAFVVDVRVHRMPCGHETESVVDLGEVCKDRGVVKQACNEVRLDAPGCAHLGGDPPDRLDIDSLGPPYRHGFKHDRPAILIVGLTNHTHIADCCGRFRLHALASWLLSQNCHPVNSWESVCKQTSHFFTEKRLAENG